MHWQRSLSSRSTYRQWGGSHYRLLGDCSWPPQTADASTLPTGKERRDQANLCSPAFPEAARGGLTGTLIKGLGFLRARSSRAESVPLGQKALEPKVEVSRLPESSRRSKAPDPGSPKSEGPKAVWVIAPNPSAPKQRFSIREDPLDQNKRPGCRRSKVGACARFRGGIAVQRFCLGVLI